MNSEYSDCIVLFGAGADKMNSFDYHEQQGNYVWHAFLSL